MDFLINSTYAFLIIVVAGMTVIPAALELQRSGFNLVKTVRIVAFVSIFYGSIALLTLGLNAMTQ